MGDQPHDHAHGHVHDHSGWRPVPILPYLDPAVTTTFWTALGFVWADPVPRLEAPEVKPWGLREMTVVDPAGTVVRLAGSR